MILHSRPPFCTGAFKGPNRVPLLILGCLSGTGTASTATAGVATCVVANVSRFPS